MVAVAVVAVVVVASLPAATTDVTVTSTSTTAVAVAAPTTTDTTYDHYYCCCWCYYHDTPLPIARAFFIGLRSLIHPTAQAHLAAQRLGIPPTARHPFNCWESLWAHTQWFSFTASPQCQPWTTPAVSIEEKKNAIEPILLDGMTQMPKRNALHVLSHVTDAPLGHGPWGEVGGTANGWC